MKNVTIPKKCIKKNQDAYFTTRLAAYQNDARRTYMVVNHLLDKQYVKSKLPQQEDLDKLANAFNKQCRNKMKNISQNIHEENKLYDYNFSFKNTQIESCLSRFTLLGHVLHSEK